MLISLHKNATTTPAIRRAIQTSAASTAELARQYGLALDTVRKWRRRDSVEDRSHTPHRLQTTLNDGQEALTVYLRTELRLSLDDLLAVVREFIEPTMSRAALDRMAVKHGWHRRYANAAICEGTPVSSSVMRHCCECALTGETKCSGHWRRRY